VTKRQPWANRIVGHGEAKPSDLVANPKNWRQHPKAQKKALAGALAEVGWVTQVIVNKRTGHLVDGHARVELALERKEPSVPVVYVDLTPDEEAVVLACLDPLSAMAETDTEKLDALMADVTVNDAALREMLGSLKTPDFEPIGADKQGKLDQKNKKQATCPECGHVFAA
jgi:ParB-like chromosome segregation protein Spo0J